MQKKRKNRRSKEKYPALKPDLNLKTRYELIDYDYLDKLSPQELSWLNKFTSEYTNADFRHSKPLHSTKKRRKECYAANNSRNRCIFTRNKACGQLDYLESKTNNPINQVLEEIDDRQDAKVEHVRKKTIKLY